MVTLQQQYRKQGFCFLDAGTIDENLLEAVQEGMLAVRDGILILTCRRHLTQATIQTDYARSMTHIWLVQSFMPYSPSQS